MSKNNEKIKIYGNCNTVYAKRTVIFNTDIRQALAELLYSYKCEYQ